MVFVIATAVSIVATAVFFIATAVSIVATAVSAAAAAVFVVATAVLSLLLLLFFCHYCCYCCACCCCCCWAPCGLGELRVKSTGDYRAACARLCNHTSVRQANFITTRSTTTKVQMNQRS